MQQVGQKGVRPPSEGGASGKAAQRGTGPATEGRASARALLLGEKLGPLKMSVRRLAKHRPALVLGSCFRKVKTGIALPWDRE